MLEHIQRQIFISSVQQAVVAKPTLICTAIEKVALLIRLIFTNEEDFHKIQRVV